MKKILLIEDTPDMRNLLQSNLAARGYAIEMADDGEKGLARAYQNQPDLILLDVRLPGMSGWEVLAKLKSDNALKTIPVIVMTASENLDDETRALDLGAVCYFTKPFSLKDFLSKINVCVNNPNPASGQALV
jgi:DNA-binding response OmpR family regulator